jgi:hypothetical protein
MKEKLVKFHENAKRNTLTYNLLYNKLFLQQSNSFSLTSKSELHDSVNMVSVYIKAKHKHVHVPRVISTRTNHTQHHSADAILLVFLFSNFQNSTVNFVRIEQKKTKKSPQNTVKNQLWAAPLVHTFFKFIKIQTNIVNTIQSSEIQQICDEKSTNRNPLFKILWWRVINGLA